MKMGWAFIRGLDPCKSLQKKFKKSSFIIQEQDSRTGQELLLICSRTAQVHFNWTNFLEQLFIRLVSIKL